MEFKTTAGSLAEALSYVATNVSETATPGFYSGVLVNATSSAVSLTGASATGSIFTVETLKTSPSETGKVIVAHKPLISYVSNLPSDLDITVKTVEDHHLTVGYEDGQTYSFSLIPGAKDYPDAPNPKKESASIGFTTLAKALPAAGKVASTMGDGVPRIRVSSTTEDLRLEATDNFRLFYAAQKGAGFRDFTYTLPKNEGERALKSQVTQVSWDSKAIRFSTPTGHSTLRALPEEFTLPDFSAHINQESETTVTVDLADFASKVARLAATAPKATLRVSLSRETLSLSLISSSSSPVSGQEDIAVIDGPTETISLNLAVRYLEDALLSCRGASTVTVGVSGALRPFQLKGSTEDLDIINVIMPVK